MFSLMSWNILSESTILSDDVKFEELKWCLRLPSILRIFTTNPDFLLLQEVNLDTFEIDFASILSQYRYVRHIRNKKRICVFGNVTCWRIGECLKSEASSRALHTTIQLKNGFTFIITNVHLPAQPGIEGHQSRLQHLKSCQKTWKMQENVIIAGDFNEGLWNPFGFASDLRECGFDIALEELSKLTCRSLRTKNLHNVDHVLTTNTMSAIFMVDSSLSVLNIPNEIIPSDHLPIVYLISQNDSM